MVQAYSPLCWPHPHHAGAAPLPGSKPYAQCYGGHQFGMWAGQLGDGRAISLGNRLIFAGDVEIHIVGIYTLS